MGSNEMHSPFTFFFSFVFFQHCLYLHDRHDSDMVTLTAALKTSPSTLIRTLEFRSSIPSTFFLKPRRINAVPLLYVSSFRLAVPPSLIAVHSGCSVTNDRWCSGHTTSNTSSPSAKTLKRSSSSTSGERGTSRGNPSHPRRLLPSTVEPTPGKILMQSSMRKPKLRSMWRVRRALTRKPPTCKPNNKLSRNAPAFGDGGDSSLAILVRKPLRARATLRRLSERKGSSCSSARSMLDVVLLCLHVSNYSSWAFAFHLVDPPSLPDFCVAGVSNLVQQWALDGDYTRFALVVTLPVIFCVSVVCIPSYLYPLRRLLIISRLWFS